MNIDGATGVIFAELGFPPPLCRGLFVLSGQSAPWLTPSKKCNQAYATRGPSRGT
jgi:citrate synthase